jgi:DNA-directed RNA polymerase specialized sigma24 family protein
MHQAAAHGSDVHHDVLNLEEIGSAIAALSDQDVIRMRRAGKSFAWGSALSGDDLIQEAILAALVGRRKCPREVAVVKFLINAMRSIASAAREAERTAGIDYTLDATGTDGKPVVIPTGIEPDAETVRLRAEDVELRMAELHELFDDDDEAMLVILGLLEGQTKEDIMSTYDFVETAYDTIRRRIRRKMNGRSPNRCSQ